ncbi:accelerated cell death 11-like [Pistacia vera]|uniref:accelerated cell death 11-like n=1 Tax=Pistacia vera TaxID=55513 RepID=UPI001262C85F|nr:accelerated cell death 11-like [Pistacia vera]
MEGKSSLPERKNMKFFFHFLSARTRRLDLAVRRMLEKRGRKNGRERKEQEIEGDLKSAMAKSDTDKPLRKIAEAFIELAATINSETADVEVAPFSHACSLVSPLIGCLGIAFKFAEMDYVAKVDDLAVASKSIMTLQALIDHDIEGNCVREVGSHTRYLSRVKRGLDVVRVLFEQIIATEGDSIKDPVSKAYAQVLAPHHGWAIRKAVAAGMYALPTKEQLLKKLNEDEASAIIQLQKYITASASVIAYIDKLFISRELGIDW